MRFSSVQEKEIIEATSGKFIGYIVDAEVDEKEGAITNISNFPAKKVLPFISRGRVSKEDCF